MSTKMIQPSLKVPLQLASAAIELSLAHIVILPRDRAASERASWKLDRRSLDVLVRRLFWVNSAILGMPSVMMTATTSTVIRSS